MFDADFDANIRVAKLTDMHEQAEKRTAKLAERFDALEAAYFTLADDVAALLVAQKKNGSRAESSPAPAASAARDDQSEGLTCSGASSEAALSVASNTKAGERPDAEGVESSRSPLPSATVAEVSGFSLQQPSAAVTSTKKRRGRPPGSKNRPKNDTPGVSEAAGSRKPPGTGTRISGATDCAADPGGITTPAASPIDALPGGNVPW